MVKPVSWLVVLLALTTLACEKAPKPTVGSASASPLSSGPPLGPPQQAAQPRRGMVWVPGGALVAGTPANSFPRIADQEMAGLQLVLDGFYIDTFAYPNEEGAIPLTNLTRDEAHTLCEERGKRLCSELEWERACKGPDNRSYEYGDRYRPEVCNTGSRPTLTPSGLRVGCKSDFGARDLHGGVWEWTDSPWGRGDKRPLATVRGGNGMVGTVVGRCANAEARDPNSKSGTIGFRCCAGPRNQAEVVFDIVGRKGFAARNRLDGQLVTRVLDGLPAQAEADLGADPKFRASKMWDWRPIANEELIAVAGCVRVPAKSSCGVLVARASYDSVNVLGWASSGSWPPSLHPEPDPRDLWLLGGDELGRFKRRVAYAWGEIRVGEKERRVGPLKKKTKKKGAKKK